ncbi:hypothetical protein Molly5_147 [Maribacter phage Molly_5]|uniref:Uncharacterized protein n=1 Tax=Maribacter phage Molly_1 TaxID=2745685 RepID=A0A8E4XZT4_9CAUD|nr:hypothetical protein M1M29_gp146 [Maribacter phage Molly_1]QQO97640.1 hypothetical protein Molly2_146 [Maribacter phage Molly_2]QQO97840.1 hypothetical protein Molly3_146 [Maribacter phage Molly_3]QQO98041.1 hypothetical protein Molly4_147 [Maribacter phage Molly_4]QQO98241.1 hypothetical protein Molly5_147 [Maribacter phage Molly_5]QQO97440.1 hypothetical protein Molly1_146 [Maribacter phage Molly_1]
MALSKIDKTIVRVVMAIMSLVLIYFLVTDLKSVLMILGSAIMVIWMLFLIMHIALLVPLFVVVTGTIALLHRYAHLGALEERSKVLYVFAILTALVPVLFFSYIGIPVLALALNQGSFDLIEMYSIFSQMMTN